MWKRPRAKKMIIIAALGALGFLAVQSLGGHALFQCLNEFVSENFAAAVGNFEKVVVGWMYDELIIDIAYR